MKKTISLICILSILLFTLTGCYSSVTIDKYFYIVALGLDFGENSLLKVSIQIASSPNSSSSGDSESSQSSGYNIYSVEAESIDSAITILNNYLNKKVNLSHCSVLVISEDIAKSGVKKYISSLGNNTELRHTCLFLISSSTAYEVLDKVSNSGEVFSSRLYDYLSTSSEYTGYTVDSTFGKFYSNLKNYERDSIGIYSKVNDDIIQNSGTAVFKDDVMVGNLDVLSTISHLMVMNELETCVLQIPHPLEANEVINLDVQLYKDSTIDVDIVNNTPYITINIYPSASILSSGRSYDYTTNKSIQEIEYAANDYITSMVSKYLYQISKNLNSDIVGFSGIYSAKVPTKEDFDKVHFSEIFQESFFKINVNTEINSSNLFNKQ